MPFIHTNKTNLYYEEKGVFNPTPILFGHGLLFNKHIFDSTIQELSKEYHCIAYDIRGHGKSATAKEDMSINTLAQDVLAIIKHTAVAPCHFVGHGLSAFVGLFIAQRYPHLIKSLTLVNPIPQLTPKDKLSYKVLSWSLKFVTLDHVANTMIRTQFSTQFINNTPQIIPYWKKQFLANSKSELSTALNTLINFSLPSIEYPKCPTYIINSNEQQLSKFPSNNGHYKVQHLLNIGHLLPVEAPYLLAQKVKEQLSPSSTQQNYTSIPQ